jgi:hypothetical protein
MACKAYRPSHDSPPKPEEISAVEKKNGKSAHISWLMPTDIEKWRPLIYIIQQKSHIGQVDPMIRQTLNG